MTGILTFHWADDYGAMLQAYALKRHLEIQGEQVEILPYASLKLTGRYWLCPLYARAEGGKIKYRPSRYGLRTNLKVGGDFWRRKKAMKEFRRRYLTDSSSKREISLEKYSHVFVGSDQVWNPRITIGLDDVYLGNIKEKGTCKLISYAASLGGSTLPQADQAKFAESVGENFTAISVREKAAAEFVSRLLHREVTDTLDPTLLLEREEWTKIGVYPEEKDYILIYWTEYNESMMKYVRTLSERLHKRVIQISFPRLEYPADWLDVRVGIGPAEFIGYFQNAFCIVTNSFHGTAFSVLLEKQFLVFSHSNFNARIENLLCKLGLEPRMKSGNEALDENILLEEVDWKMVKERLDEEKRQSIQFICENLKK